MYLASIQRSKRMDAMQRANLTRLAVWGEQDAFNQAMNDLKG